MDDIKCYGVSLLDKDGRVIDPANISEDVDVVNVRLILGGKTGSYWLAIAIESDAEQADLPTLAVSEYISIAGDKDTEVTFAFPINEVPPGHYAINFSVGSTKLGSVELAIVPKE